MKVELVAYTQPFCGFDDSAWNNPLSLVEKCACVCYDSKPTEDYRIAKSCIDSGHQSIAEHISFTFHISGVSRSLLAQLSRHRHISLSVRSQRYNTEENFESVVPEFDNLKSKIDFERTMDNISKEYRNLLNSEKPENARAVLPNACCTELYITANARALIEMSYLRLCSRSQLEIRTMFQEIKKQVATVCPEIAEYMVPKCEKNPNYPFCDEKKSCGRHKTLKENHGLIPFDEIKDIAKSEEIDPKPIYVISNTESFPGTIGCNSGWCELRLKYALDIKEPDEIEVFAMGWDCPMYVELSEYNKTWFAYYEKPEKDEIDDISSN